MENLEKIYEGNKSTVFKGKYPDYPEEVIVKVLNAEFPSTEQVNRFNNEFDFTEKLDIHGVRKVYKKEKKAGKNCLVLESFGKQTLKGFIKENNDIKSLIRIAIKISKKTGSSAMSL